jgi:TolB-like protein/tetratricopeptide (TPR) repeat protein/DNA-binding winged helix-turn-helix (wHTH) protein
MDAADLRAGFRLGEWRVEPQELRLSGPKGTFVLEPEHMQLLMCLVEHHGEAVDRRTLRERAWPGRNHNDQLLRAGIRTLREALGKSPSDQSYIVTVSRGGFALIAHFEALEVVAASHARSQNPDGHPERRSLVGRLQALVFELRRRSVFKVSGGYLLGMWIMLQVAEVTFEPLRLPDWWMTALTILAVLGLPIVATLAWSYEITPGGIVLDVGAPEGMKLPRARRAVAPAIVAGVALMAAVTGAAWWRSIETGGTEASPQVDPANPSVAVLPLVDMSPSGGNDYLGDGLSEELSMRLAQVPGLRVAARTSAFEFKDRNVDVRRIGQSLGVRHVLEGSVRRDGDNLRVTMQLIDAATGYHVWAGSYDRSWSDVISIQDEIARSVSEALRIVLVPKETSPQAASVATLDVRAVDPYLAGLAMLRQSGDMSRLQEAAERFAAAIEIEPSFARAYAGLCRVGVRIYDRSRDPADLARAEGSCRRALELDASLVETEKALGGLYLSSGRIAESEAIYQTLVTRNPQDADGHIGLGQALAAAGRFDVAERSFRTAVQVEPAFWGAFNALGGFLFSRGRIDEAIDAYREVSELTPSSASAYNNLGAALQMKGDLRGAADAFRRSLAIEPARSAYSNLGTVHYFLRDFDEAAANYERATALAGQDQSLWGNLADAVWQIPGRREEAIGHYRQAIRLGLRELESQPTDGLLMAQLGYYYGRLGDAAASGRYLDQAAAKGADLYVQYYSAVAAADRGDLEKAREGALAAVELGYPETLLQADPSLAGLKLQKKNTGDEP